MNENKDPKNAIPAIEHPPSKASGLLAELEACETVVREAQHTLFRVAAALKAIHDKKLYKLKGYKSFKAYVQAELGFTRSRAYQLVDSAQVLENLSTVVDAQRLPASEYQTRFLSQLSPKAQRTVYTQALESAPAGPLTSRHLQAAVKQYRAQGEDSENEAEACQRVLGPIGRYLWRKFQDMSPRHRRLMMEFLRDLAAAWSKRPEQETAAE